MTRDAVGVSVAHVDPKKVERALELQRRYPQPPDAARGAANVLRTGQSEMNAAALLQAGAPPARPVEVIDRPVRHMSRMVDDLLEVSRIARGKIDLRREPLDIADVVREVASDRAQAAHDAGLLLSLETPAAPIRVLGDRTRLAQAVTNLVANSIKFSETGGRIVIRVSVEGSDARISVKDGGIGIDAQTLESVFEAFTQADRTLDRSRGGLGLGLAIVRGLIELHGGRVTAHSEGPRRGSEFTISLPLARTQEAPAKTTPALPPLPPLRILIVEDNRDAAEMMRDVLAHDGHTVAVCFTGERAADDAREFRPDVVLCDLGLPRKDGFAVAQELRADRDFAKTRLVAVSGYGTEADRERARGAGFDEHLTKPIDPARLHKVLASLLTGTRESS